MKSWLAILTLAAAAASAAEVRTPVFRGALSMSGRTVALFEIAGNAGTWQGEAGRTLPGTSWRIERIDPGEGAVTVRIPGKTPFTLRQGDTYQSDRVVKAPEVERPEPPPRRVSPGRAAPMPFMSGLNPQLQNQLMAALKDPRVKQQLSALGLSIPRGDGRGGLTFGPGDSARIGRRAPTPAPSPRSAASSTPAAVPAATLPPPMPTTPPRVPVIRAIDASATTPDLAGLARIGDDTVVMVLGADAASKALKPKVLALPSKRPRTALVFVDTGANAKAPVLATWGITQLPHFFLLDPGGGVTASGEKARAQIDGWIGAK